MEVRVLRYFLTVAREGSITGAANSLHLTQPTLSRQLQDFRAYHLGQSCPEYGPSYHEKSYHHDYYLVGEACQGFFRSQDMEYQQTEQGAQGHDVGTEFPGHEESCRDNEYDYGYEHLYGIFFTDSYKFTHKMKTGGEYPCVFQKFLPPEA